ncbi:glycosyltransferase family 1 protein [Paenibacillus spongiae]|uniref:Glycosyltransferase family 1 protein n=1 Tax=Paenibacillus spongiae TaxID=2909671 RepID=A0ABY5SDA2_9BACL|nr:glycosyltransferase family 1 protein [Paenibacillus spongiae]UVI31523.1 glycosyltransferase family 1 protein [Paenibacillus spongiae]
MNRGGLETMLMNYYRKIDRSQVQFDFMVHRNERGHYDDEIERLGGKIYRMPAIRPGQYRNYFGKLDAFFIDHPDYQVVHSHINENSGFVLRAAKKAGIPCRIAHSHLSDNRLDMKLPFRIYARMNMSGHPNHYFACSKNAGKWLFGHSQNVTILNNAVNVEDFQYNESIREEIQAELGVEGRFVMGHIGRFYKQKNHTFLLDIFKAVHMKNPKSVLVLVGEGQLRATMEKKAAKLGLTDHVKFLGVRKDIARLLQGFDIFLLPSLFEGLPVVLVEAQAAGLMSVVSDTITREADVTGRVEFVGLKQSPEEWAERILASTNHHIDTSMQLAASGYDTATATQWLVNYYNKHA